MCTGEKKYIDKVIPINSIGYGSTNISSRSIHILCR